MNHLPTMSTTARLNALAAAVVVTLTLLSGIDALATAHSTVPQLTQTVLTQPA